METAVRRLWRGWFVRPSAHAESVTAGHAARAPHLNGKVERFHGTDDQEFYQLLDQGGVTDDIHLFNEKAMLDFAEDMCIRKSEEDSHCG